MLPVALKVFESFRTFELVRFRSKHPSNGETDTTKKIQGKKQGEKNMVTATNFDCSVLVPPDEGFFNRVAKGNRAGVFD